MSILHNIKLLSIFALLCFSSSSFGLSPAIPTPPGNDLILSGRCEEFAKVALATEQSKTDRDWAYWWSRSMTNLPISKRLSCIALLPENLQYRIFLADVAKNNPSMPDLSLIEMWHMKGGDLNFVRTETRSLATAVAETGFVVALQRLRELGLAALPESDKANELTAASRRINGPWRADGDKSPHVGPTPFEWLLKNEYAWPLEPSATHELLSNLAKQPDSKLFEMAMDVYKRKDAFSKIINFDNTQSIRPIIYFARTVKAIELLHQVGFNIHAKHVDRKTAAIYRSSVLEEPNLPLDVQTALLYLKVSVAASSSLNNGSLYAVLSTPSINLEIVERFLQAGASLYMNRVSRPDGTIVRLHAIHFVAEESLAKFKEDELRKIIKLLVEYGADPNVIPEGAGNDWDATSDNLPLHSAIYSALWSRHDWKPEHATFSIWLEASKIKPDVQHPRLKLSLIGYALKTGVVLNSNRVNQVIDKLVELGAPINPTGESLLLAALKTYREPNMAIVNKLLDLGANPNQIDSKSGLSVLTHLLTAKPYNSNDCISWSPHHRVAACAYETRNERLERIRWFVSRGANPRLKDSNGKSALDFASEFAEVDKRNSYEAALLGGTQ